MSDDDEHSIAPVLYIGRPHVPFTPPPNDAPVIEAPKDYLGCQHHQVIVDSELRTVKCSKCGVTLDPVQVLIEQAKYYRRVDYKVQAIKQNEEREKLRREKAEERRKKKAAKPVKKKTREEVINEKKIALSANYPDRACGCGCMLFWGPSGPRGGIYMPVELQSGEIHTEARCQDFRRSNPPPLDREPATGQDKAT